MKKLKIENPKWRTVAGVPIFLVITATALILFVLILYCLGQVARPLFNVRYPNIAGDYDSYLSITWGSFVLAYIAATGLVIFGLYRGSKWAGNRLFNNIAAKESKN